MTQEQLKAFLEKVKGDNRLQEMLKAVKSPDEAINIAKQNVNELTTDQQTNLSEAELEGVAGGHIACFGNSNTFN